MIVIAAPDLIPPPLINQLKAGFFFRSARSGDANYPDQRFTLRNGILVIRRYPRREALKTGERQFYRR
jgi:hypothetical protein